MSLRCPITRLAMTEKKFQPSANYNKAGRMPFPFDSYPDMEHEKDLKKEQSESDAFDLASPSSLMSAGIVAVMLIIVLYLYSTHVSAQLSVRKELEEPRRQLDAPAAAITRSRRGVARAIS